MTVFFKDLDGIKNISECLDILNAQYSVENKNIKLTIHSLEG